MNQAVQWAPHEIKFTSKVAYENSLYQIDTFYADFTSPTGKVTRRNGFWDGGTDWKIRFMPDELGNWTYKTTCSDNTNSGLHQQTGAFVCGRNSRELPIYQHGAIEHLPGNYHLSYADKTPFLWIGCTAWNGTLKSTDAEWDTYLKHRADHGYSVIQFVTTQWRGADMNSQLQVAYTGRNPIQIHPAFFQHLDQKIDKINEYGLVAAPVLLWALPIGEGRELSPGYQLSQQEAILLAKYMVARYGAHHVVWLLGGDGLYVKIYEQRWKNIGRAVFGEEHPGVVAQHPMGHSWIGNAYAEEEWLDVVGYQSGHSSAKSSVEYITRGPAARAWHQLPARPIINTEPCYEEIFNQIDADAVRDALYWSLLATPVAGVTYGANGIWPWIREGETILNHGELSRQSVSNWRESLDLPGSQQASYLSAFIRQLEWWKLKPLPDLLIRQPGEQHFAHHISLAGTEDYRTLLAYIPTPHQSIEIHNPQRLNYRIQWFDPVHNRYFDHPAVYASSPIKLTPPQPSGHLLILQSFV